jgi:hypothetical protein
MERAEIYYIFHAYCVIAPGLWSLREIQRAKGQGDAIDAAIQSNGDRDLTKVTKSSRVRLGLVRRFRFLARDSFSYVLTASRCKSHWRTTSLDCAETTSSTASCCRCGMTSNRR